MNNSKPPRVKHLPLKGAPLSVDSIAEHRMAEVLEVDSNLVCPAGVECALDQRSRDKLSTHPPARSRRPPSLDDRHLLPMHRVATDRSIDFTCLLAEFTLDQSEIDLCDTAPCKLPHERLMGGVILRRYQTAARLLVEPMDDAGSLDASDPTQGGAMVQECIDERIIPVADSGVHDESGGLVDHDEVVVFVQDTQRDVPRHDVARDGVWLGKFYCIADPKFR